MLRSPTRTVHAPHSPTRQHSFVPVRPASSRSTSSRVWCGSTSSATARPLIDSSTRKVVTMPRPRDAARRAARSAVATARSPRTWSIASRYSGLARIDRGDGLASTNSASSRSIFARSVAAGSARTPVSSTTRSGRGPRLPYPIRVTPSRGDGAGQGDRRQVVAASPRPPHVDGAGRVGRTRQLDRGDQLAGRERRDAGPDEDLVDRDRPDAARAGHLHARPVDEQRRDGVGRRRRVADVPGQRGPVPDLHRPDHRGRLGQRAEVSADARVLGDVGHDGPCPDREARHRSSRRSRRRAPRRP